MEGLDLATDERRDARSARRPSATSTPSAGEVLAGAVGREDLDAEREQVAGERRDPVAVGDRQQGSHPGLPPSQRQPRATVVAAEYSARRGILRPSAARTETRGHAAPRRAPPAPSTTRHGARIDREARALGVPVHAVQPRNFPDLFTPTWIASLVLLVVLVVLYNVRTRALHRHAPYLDLWEWLLWTGLITSSGCCSSAAVFVVRLVLVLVIDGRSGSATLSGSGSAGSRRSSTPTSSSSRKQRYFTRTKFARSRGDDPRRSGDAADRSRRPPPATLTASGPCRSRSAGSASATGGRRAARHARADRPGHPQRRARGVIAELAFARGARIEPHANPNTTWFIVIEGGGWVGVGDERDPGRGGRGGPLAGRT